MQEGKISFHSLCRDRKSRVAGPLYREISSIGPYIFMQMEQVKLNAFIFLINMSILKNNIFIYLAVPGLSCGMWDLVP